MGDLTNMLISSLDKMFKEIESEQKPKVYFICLGGRYTKNLDKPYIDESKII